jgi:hypothetical protein
LHTAYRAPRSVLAIDWSGDVLQARKRIYLAEAREPGTLVRVECGRTREEIADAIQTSDAVAVGLDFGFSYPAAYLEQLHVESAPELWALVAARGEDWLVRCEPPFWGRGPRKRPISEIPTLRRAERALQRVGGIAPKSLFQLGGAGAVGTGSIRGMPVLDTLHQAGVTLWPFTSGARGPTVLEIYPRLLTGKVHKSNPIARRAYLNAAYPDLAPDLRGVAEASEDAFDAAVSALVMVEHVADLAQLPEEPDPVLRLEGRIWHPAWRDDPV